MIEISESKVMIMHSIIIFKVRDFHDSITYIHHNILVDRYLCSNPEDSDMLHHNNNPDHNYNHNNHHNYNQNNHHN